MRGVKLQGFKTPSREAQLVFKRVLVAVDGSKNAAKAARVAVELAKRYRAELLILHVILTPRYLGAVPARTVLDDYYAYAKKEAQKEVDEVVSLGNSRGVKITGKAVEYSPSVVEAITKHAANKKIDLIVVGTRGLSGFKKLLIGSVSAGVVGHAHCSVLVIR